MRSKEWHRPDCPGYQALSPKNPTPLSTRTHQQPFIARENAVIEELMAVILQHGLSADHAATLLGQTIELLEWGQQAAHKTPEVNA